jgi:tRNA pseudouridine55 synthase
LGESTDTLDCKGIVTDTRALSRPWAETCQAIEGVYPQFIGPITQQIPAFSAKKISGERMYKMARKGTEFTLPFKSVEIQEISTISHDEAPFFQYSATCSKGTYIRQLSVDLAAAIGELAYTDQLRRTAVGPYLVENALSLENFSLESVEKALFEQAPIPASVRL